MKHPAGNPKAFPLSMPLVTGAVLLMIAGVSSAQSLRLPSAAEPGRELHDLPKLEPIATPAGISVPESPSDTAPPGADKFVFELQSVQVQGSTILSQEAIARYYQAILGKQVSVAQMFAVAAEIEKFYRSSGYVTSRVIVPKQEIQNGHFEIIIVEGYIADVELADSAELGGAATMVRRLLHPITLERPVSVQAIEHRLLLVNDLAGIVVKSVLKPSKDKRGGSTLLITVERQPVSVALNYDNRNSPYTSRRGLQMSVSANSIGVHANTFSITTKTSTPVGAETVIAAGYRGNFGDKGAVWSLSAYDAKSHPGLELEPQDVRSHSHSLSANFTYPLIRSRLSNLSFDGGFEYRNVQSETLGQLFGNDRLRILTLGMRYDQADNWNGITALRLSYARGLPIFNASGNSAADFNSRTGASGRFGLYGLQLSRVQQLPYNFSLFVSGIAQHSDELLLASEEFSLGSASIGRGYDPGALTGINGFAATQELRYSFSNISFLPQGIQLYQFYDYGQVGQTPTGLDTADLASIGLGLRVNVRKNMQVFGEFAKPLEYLPVGAGGPSDLSPQLYFGISAQF